jgi:hypothetical protein
VTPEQVLSLEPQSSSTYRAMKVQSLTVSGTVHDTVDISPRRPVWPCLEKSRGRGVRGRERGHAWLEDGGEREERGMTSQ